MTRGISIDTSCNLACEYCYEHPSREVKQPEYDVEAIMDRLKDWKEMYPNESPPGLHGGEPLLIPDDDIERFFEFIDEHWETPPWIQTNGSLINERHIEMFERYNVSVGISCDGPGELNKKRKAKNGKTDQTTQKTINNIHRLADRGINVGMIVVLHKHNAGTDEKLSKLLDWLDGLTKKGVRGHFNVGRMPTGDLQLSPERYGEVLIETLEWVDEEEYRVWDPVIKMRQGMLEGDVDDCKYGTCDPRGAGYAKTITGSGDFSGCARMWAQIGDGNPTLQGPSNYDSYDSYQLRYEMLQKTPQDAGGCAGCPFWELCKGGCPANGIDDDYRRKTVWCEGLKAFYEHVVINRERMGISEDIDDEFVRNVVGQHSFDWEDDDDGEWVSTESMGNAMSDEIVSNRENGSQLTPTISHTWKSSESRDTWNQLLGENVLHTVLLLDVASESDTSGVILESYQDQHPTSISDVSEACDVDFEVYQCSTLPYPRGLYGTTTRGATKFIVTTPEHSSTAERISCGESDVDEFVEFLNIPQCCAERVVDVESDTGHEKQQYYSMIVDTATEDDDGIVNENRVVEENVEYMSACSMNPTINVFWKYFGVSLLQYRPCTLRCTEAIEQATHRYELLESYDSSVAERVGQWLSSPLEYDSLNGIGHIKNEHIIILFTDDHYWSKSHGVVNGGIDTLEWKDVV